MNTFLVTSSINVLQSYGVYTPSDRFDQTIASIDSIRKYAKPAKIILLETTELTDEQNSALTEKVDIICNYANNKFIRKIEDNYEDKYHYIKTPSEIYMLANILTNKYIKQQIMFSDFDSTTYKLSGRYRLTPKFSELEQQYEGITFLKRKPFVVYYDEKTSEKLNPECQNLYQYSTKLFSFDTKSSFLLEYSFKKMLKYVLKVYEQKRYIDFEHVVAQFFHGVNEVDELGIVGNYALTGEEVYE